MMSVRCGKCQAWETGVVMSDVASRNSGQEEYIVSTNEGALLQSHHMGVGVRGGSGAYCHPWLRTV